MPYRVTVWYNKSMTRNKNITINCNVCGKEFHPHHGKENQKYCGRKCYSIGKTDQVTLTCEACGKTFNVYKARSHARFCSRECHSTKAELICEYCGDTYYVKRSDKGRRRTCSKTCASKLRSVEGTAPHTGKARPESTRKKVSEGLRLYYKKNPRKHWNFKGGNFSNFRGRYSDWQLQRKRARSRALYKCEVCGISETTMKKQLSVHHIIPFRKFSTPQKANELSNLICVCQSCHMKLECGTITLPPHRKINP